MSEATYTITEEQFEEKLTRGEYFVQHNIRVADATSEEERSELIRQLIAVKERQAELLKEFKEDLFIVIGIAGHLKADKLFQIAWDAAHADGYWQVYFYARDLSVLLDKAESPKAQESHPDFLITCLRCGGTSVHQYSTGYGDGFELGCEECDGVTVVEV